MHQKEKAEAMASVRLLRGVAISLGTDECLAKQAWLNLQYEALWQPAGRAG